MSQSRKAIKEPNAQVTAIQTDAIDELMFETMKDAKKFKELCESDEENNSNGLCQDAFTSFYAHEPVTSPDAEPVQKGVMDAMMSLDEYHVLRASTEYDELSATVSAMQFGPELITQYIELKKKFEEKKKEAAAQGKDGPKDLKDTLSGLEMSGLRNSMRKGLEKAQKQADELGNAMTN